MLVLACRLVLVLTFSFALGIETIPEAFLSIVLGTNSSDEMGVVVTTDPGGNVYIAGRAVERDGEAFGKLVVPIADNPSTPVDDLDPPEQGIKSVLFSTSSGSSVRVQNSTGQINSTVVGPEVGRPARPRRNHTASDTELTDIFLAKIEANGNVSWVRRFGSPDLDMATSITYFPGIVCVAGKTFGPSDGATKDTPDGTSDLFAMAFTESGDAVWTSPLQIGSGGQDGIQSIALDPVFSLQSPNLSRRFLYISGHIGGSNVFRQAERRAGTCKTECGCLKTRKATSTMSEEYLYSDAGIGDEDSAATTQRTKNSSSSEFSESGHPHMKVEPKNGKASEYVDSTGLFVAKVGIEDGAIVDAAQLHLKRNSSADSIVAHGGKLFVAVNSFGNSRMDAGGDTALYVFCAEDLSYRVAFPPKSISNEGKFVQSLATGHNGDLYLAGYTPRQGKLDTGSYFVQKYDVSVGTHVWEKQLGHDSRVEPHVSLVVGSVTGNIFVAGYTDGFYAKPENHVRDRDRNGSKAEEGPVMGMIRIAVTMFSPAGMELITWDKISPFPSGYEAMTSVALDRNENMIYTGHRLDPQSGAWDLVLGSLGSQSFSARAEAEQKGSEILETENPVISVRKHGSSTLLISLICLASSISLVIVVAVSYTARNYLSTRRFIVGPAGGFYYENDEYFRFEDTTFRRHSNGHKGGYFATKGSNSSSGAMSFRSGRSGARSLALLSSRQRDSHRGGSLPRQRSSSGPGGSSGPM